MADLGSTKVFGDLTVAGDIRIGGASVIDTINAGDNTAVKLTGNQTVAGVKTFSSTITGSVSGNAATATKLATASTIAGVAFDGSANITLTAANVGAIATTGGTSTGNITAPDFIQSSTQSTNAAACTRKDYVDSAIAAGDALQVSKTGDTMTGGLTAPKVLVSGAQGTEVNALTRKDYVDSAIAAGDAPQVSKSGDTMTGALTVTKSEHAFVLSPASGTSSYILGQQGGTDSWYIGKPSASSDNIALHSYALSTTLTLTDTNIVSSRIVSAPDYSVTSDVRLKSNFEKIENPLEKVSKLEGLVYDKKSKFNSDITREGGLIAQAVRDVMPEAVREDDDGYLSISTSSIIALLLESIKELKREVDDLKKENLNGCT